MNTETIFHILGVVAVASPFVLLGILGLALLLEFRFSEQLTALLTQVAVALGLTASIAVLAMMLATGVR
ncbi:MAG: oxidoreductase, partial [Rubripirellula sp.]